MIKEIFLEQARGRETPDRERIAHLVSAYLASYASGDIEGRLRLFAPDARFEDPVGTAPMIGHDALRAFFSQGSGFALKAELESLAICGREAAFVFRATIDAGSGGTVSIRPMETLKVDDDGLIAHMRAYFDAGSIN